MSALKTLTTPLKGIGPATASLLLSVKSPESVPFFSDEMFRWCMWDEAGGVKGWGRKIKYDAKEYGMLCEKVEGLRKRLGVGCVDVERVAWVLGKESVDCGEEEQEDEEEKQAEKEVAKKVEKKGTKRKVVESKAPAEGTRKSARTKK